MLVSNRKVQPEFASSKELTNSLPSDSRYTICRTIEQVRILDYSTHLQRLISLPGITVENFEPYLLRYSSQILHEFHNFYIGLEEFTSETRLTMTVSRKGLWEYDDTGLDVDLIIYGEKLPPVPSPPINVIAAKGHRDTPELKSSQWIQERKKYEDAAKIDTEFDKIEESVLVNEQGYFTEGLSSNFAIIQNDTFVTAPKGTVLEGTVLKLILIACEHEGIPVERRFIHTSDIAESCTALISSTTRGALPIQNLAVFGEIKSYTTSPVLVKIQVRK